MNNFFTTNVDKSLTKTYRWIPVAYFAFVATLLTVTLFDIPQLQDNQKLIFIVFLIVVFSGSINMFCVQALARIESKLIEQEKN